MAKQKLIENLLLTAEKGPKGYEPVVSNIKSRKVVKLKNIFKTPEECLRFLETNLPEIKKDQF